MKLLMGTVKNGVSRICHSGQREESPENLRRSFAEPVLSNVEGFRMTDFVLKCTLPAILIITILWPHAAQAIECKPGRFIGTTWSVNQKLHKKQATLVVTKQGDACVFRFKCPDAGVDEIWEWKGNRLVQRELDADGKEIALYHATLLVRDGVEGFYIDCPQGAGMPCEGGADARSFWTITTPDRKIIYQAWSVDPKRASDPKAKARKRYEYTFTPSP